MFNVEDLILLIVALIIGMIYDVTMNNSTHCVDSYIGRENIIKSPRIVTSDIIKERLIQIYNSNIMDKRERIVSLLIQLDDPDEFYEDHDYIREFIFNST